jgi:hypothetical protein
MFTEKSQSTLSVRALNIEIRAAQIKFTGVFKSLFQEMLNQSSAKNFHIALPCQIRSDS